MKFADPKSDIAFKKIFGNENRKEILISFLNAVLGLTGDAAIEDVEILNPYQAPRIVELKETVLDVRARDKRGVTFIVEMQVERQEYFGKRALYYSSKAYVSQIDRAIDFPRLNQVIFIGILDFDYFSNDHYLSRHLILNKENYRHELTDLEFNFIELAKFTKGESDLKSVVDKWIYFIKNAENLDVIPSALKRPRAIREAFEMANRFNWTKEEMEVYDYWEMEEATRLDALNTARKTGMAEGIAEGIEKGIEKGRQEGIKTGMKEGMLEQAKEMVVDSLQERFGNVPEVVIDKVKVIAHIEQLKALHKAAITCQSIDEFQRQVEKLARR